MARPAEAGCLYFPLDCNFFEDRKVRLLRARFGAKAEAVLLRLWCMIYGGDGWYLHLDVDEIALMAESMGSGYSPNYIRDVIGESCERGIFEKSIFAKFQVLTSAGIQKRYLSVKAKKKIIPIIREYWVLNEAFFKGENQSLLLKLQFFSVSAEKTAVTTEETQVCEEETKQKKRKGNKTKEEKKPCEPGGWAADFAAGDRALEKSLLDFEAFRRDIKKPMTDIGIQRFTQRLQHLTEEAGVQDRGRYMREMIDASILSGWIGVFPLKEFTDAAPVHLSDRGDAPRQIAATDDISAML